MKRLVILLGLTGAGKDTQAGRLSAQFGYHVINTGAGVRRRMQTDTVLQQQIARGLLADDQLVNDIVATAIDQLPVEARIVCDGFPRRLSQAEWFDGWLAETGRTVELVIWLQVSSAISLQRLTGRERIDDQPAVIRQRQQLFEQATRPVLNYYQRRGLVHPVNGEQTIDAVAADIAQLVQP